MSTNGSSWTDAEGYTVFDDESTERRKRDNDPEQKSGKTRAPHFSNALPPTDTNNVVYFTFVMAGIGFLLPYNSFIMAVDFFKDRYPNTTIIFDMSTVYIITAFFAVLINNILVEALTLNKRIDFGYIVSITTLIFVAFCEVWWHNFGLSTEKSYTINLIAVAIVAFGCTVQQSSFYGFASMLPSSYTQAVMTGESFAGFWISVNRLSTKAAINGETANTVLFFVVCSCMVLCCAVMNIMIRKSPFVQYYIKLCQDSRQKIVLEPTEDSGLVFLKRCQRKNTLNCLSVQMCDLTYANELGASVVALLKTMDPLEDDAKNQYQYGFLKIPIDNGDSSKPFSFANPVYDPATSRSQNSEESGTSGQFLGEVDGRTSCNEERIVVEETIAGTKYKVEEIVIRMRPTPSNTGPVYVGSGSRLWNGIKVGWHARWKVAKLIWEDMAAIALAYFMTLCIYPGILSEIHSCDYGSWLPVILMTLFNGFDLMGKICGGRPIKWGKMLLPFNGLRIFAIILCLIIMGNATTNGELEYCAVVLAIFLGITNGVFGSIPMIIAPGKVAEQYREISGNIMTLSYNVGLTAGSIAAYFLNDVIKFGDHQNECPDREASTISIITRSTISTVTSNSTVAAIGNITEYFHNQTHLTTLSTLITNSTLINFITPTTPLALLNSSLANLTTNIVTDDQ